MELSKRLYAVAALVTPGNRLADVGTDHGYIPIFLTEEGKISHGVAMDVNRGPLMRAMEHIRENGMEDRIETRLSDGLKELEPGEVDTAVIAGMGGALTIRILEEGWNVAESLKELVLQPQSEIARVRRWLEAHSLKITEEDMVLEDGKYYPMMRVVHGQMCLPREIDARYGPILLQKKHPCLREYLCWERQIKENVLKQLENAAGENAAARRTEVEWALEQNGKALEEIGQEKEKQS